MKPLPEHVWYQNSYWRMTERKLFGYGYYRLTTDLRYHPRGNFVTTGEMCQLLMAGKEALVVVGEPVKNVQIVDAVPYKG